MKDDLYAEIIIIQQIKWLSFGSSVDYYKFNLFYSYLLGGICFMRTHGVIVIEQTVPGQYLKKHYEYTKRI